MDKDKTAQEAFEETGKKQVDGQELPPAGPHATKEQTHESKTPGTGALPDREDKQRGR
ncbi:hypothetical protein HJA86_09220 [Rhizobium bangladeshense]|nr:hypothetical protein [Rhizobium bangladeshense]